WFWAGRPQKESIDARSGTTSANAGRQRLASRRQSPKVSVEGPWIYLGRAAGGDCHHWHSGRLAAARGSGGARGRAANSVYEQAEAIVAGGSELRFGTQRAVTP